MTHPAPHPGTPTPPAGPSRLAQFASLIDPRARAKRKAAAATAGSYGRSATPLTGQHRADNYRRQTGRDGFTPRQWRRFVHKSHRATARVAA